MPVRVLTGSPLVSRIPLTALAKMNLSTRAAADIRFQPTYTEQKASRLFRSNQLTILHGSSLEAETYRTLFQTSVASDTDTAPVDLLLTDPPYCLLNSRKRNEEEASEPTVAARSATARRKLLWDPSGAASTLRFSSAKQYSGFTEQWLRLLLPYCKPDAVFVIWTNFLGIQPIVAAVSRATPERNLWHQMLWLKPAKPPAESQPKSQRTVQHDMWTPEVVAPVTAIKPRAHHPYAHTSPPSMQLSLTANEVTFRAYETALVFGPGQFNPWRERQRAQQNSASSLVYSDPPSAVVAPYEEDVEIGTQTSSVAAAFASASADSSDAVSGHPNQKPLRVLLPLLHSYSTPGSLVLDPFAGSGAHGVASLLSGRRVALVESNQVWARKMLETLTQLEPS
jgi:DNA modification methylase